MERFKIFIEEPFDLKNTARCVTKLENYLKIKDAIKMAWKELSNRNSPPTLSMLGIIQD